MLQLPSGEKPGGAQPAAGKSKLAFAAGKDADGVRGQVAARTGAAVGRSKAERWKVDGETARARLGWSGHVGLDPGRRPDEAAAFARGVYQTVADLDR